MYYAMRPAVPADRDDVVAMVRARAEWMRVHGHGRWVSWHGMADVLGGQIGNGWPVWVLTAGRSVLGCTTATEETPELGWTEQERTEPALWLQSTATFPNHDGRHPVGTLIAFWALDRAARLGAAWVRRGVLTNGAGDNVGLVRYYRWQGWRVVRACRHPRKEGVMVWSLARPAEPQPELSGILREVGAMLPNHAR
ncbi:hypothetical protein [Streptoalloteichus hindustanus]|uniref:N-acetyltransferase domain-containing protein n=1 Tax=Streptoalloteichus hindustanus TaxID=2017 RepID=A0A1M5F0G2_STRHI|nr:hypothetical protein [Streptoalloteichus hindustanus]SHF85033.1 hypothetical protein SAMN05444320_105223 [Streptoalloteichus hindustanus]